MREEKNKLTPEFFFADVAKKNKVDVKIVRELYNNYLKRVLECVKTERKVMVRGLGTLQFDERKLLKVLYLFGDFLNKYPEKFIDSITFKHDLWYKEMSKVYKELLKLKPLKGYEYIEGSLQKLRLNYGRIEELFDNKGNCRRDFIIKNEDMPWMFTVLEEQGGICNSES